MKSKLTRSDYEEIEQLVENALSAMSKKAAEKYTKRLDFIAGIGGFQGPVCNILAELSASTKSAAGKVADKDQKCYFARMDLHKLSSHIGDENDE